MTFDQAWEEWLRVAPFKANNLEFARFFFEAGRKLDRPEPCELLKKRKKSLQELHYVSCGGVELKIP